MRALQASVLGYHDVEFSAVASGFQGPGARRYKVDAGDFVRHLGLLEAAGWQPTPVIRRPADVSTGVIRALTFDDGGACAALIADALEARGWRGHFFVVTGLIGTPGFVDEHTLVDLASRGHLVGTHSHTHPSMLAHADPDLIFQEWSRSVGLLADVLGAPVTTGSVPGGSTSRTVVRQAAAAGIQVLLTSEPTTRVLLLEGCAVIGRYQLTGTDSPGTALALACGRAPARIRRSMAWKGRRAAHRVLGANYLRLREALLRGVKPSER
jgi:peptidoglycan/xylan/chitin deacetylase (PgdA/CDA1 family)